MTLKSSPHGLPPSHAKGGYAPGSSRGPEERGSAHAIRFLETLEIPQGPKAGDRLKLAPFQHGLPRENESAENPDMQDEQYCSADQKPLTQLHCPPRSRTACGYQDEDSARADQQNAAKQRKNIEPKSNNHCEPTNGSFCSQPVERMA